MRRGVFSSCIAILILCFTTTGCSVADRAGQSAMLGSEAGSSIGVLIGKRAGNPVVGATIGAALGASTGAFIGKRLDSLAENHTRLKPQAPLVVINGIPYKIREAHTRLNRIPSNQIESIVVLKDEEAIALYGNKGEHGAVVISVKRPG